MNRNSKPARNLFMCKINLKDIKQSTREKGSGRDAGREVVNRASATVITRERERERT